MVKLMNGPTTAAPITVRRRPRKPSTSASPTRTSRRRAGPVVWSFDELQPAGGIAELGAANRHDPYYSWVHWPYPVKASWLPARHAAHLFPTKPRRYIESAADEDALDRVLHAGARTSRHTGDVYATLLGAVHGWKTCTPEQLAALTGRQDLWSGATMPYATSIRAGLVQMGITSTTRGRPKLLRPAPPWEAHDRLLEELPFGQLVTVTGGQNWASGPDTPRHNVLATEVALRAAEYCDVASVLTEEYSRLGELAGRPRSPEGWMINPRAAADLTIVRTDGLRIAVEVTATTSKNLERKIESYAHLFANGAPDLVVVFLLVPSLAPGAPRPSKLRGKVESLIETAVRRHPGTSFAPSAHQFGVTAWDEWFPAPGLLSERFLALTAARPADVTQARVWSPVDFLDAGALPMAPSGTGTPERFSDGRWMITEMARCRRRLKTRP